MNAHIVSLLTASLLFCGCSSGNADKRVEAVSSKPSSNMSPETPTLAQLQAEGRELADARLDVVNLEPYTSIKPGTRVFVQLTNITDFIIDDGWGPPHRYQKPFPSEYIFRRIWPSHVELRMTNSTRSIYFAGRYIQSIRAVRPNTTLEPTATAP
jgi:hypothetical protein